ncbi:MFS transporter [Sulfobacillus thermosulfidooxidans]|uniref:MFS transporter n=1 Tax=Sulfobacillus thermosulfidooxidans TaxID=28034 RepID=UPI0004000FE1|nr:MFS transporter [Sulfobacillus thermosulfidooxidans]
MALVGIGGVLATDALTFTLAASLIFIGIRHWVRPAPVSTDNASRLMFLATLRSGLAVVFQRPAIRTFVVIGIMVNMGMFTTALWPGLVESRLHGTATDLGWIMVAGVVGSIAGGLIVGPLEGRFGVGYVASAGLLVYGAVTGFIAIVPWLTLVTALSFVSRVGLQIVSSSSTALFQASVPTEHRATVGGFLNAIGLIGLPVSLTIAGYLSNRFGPGDLFIASGVWFAVMAAIVFRTRSLRQRVADMAHLA